MTGVDVDGDGNNREYEEVGGYTNYVVDAACELTISASSNGRTKFYGRSPSLSGITFENKASWMANFENPNNEITFVMGQSGKILRDIIQYNLDKKVEHLQILKRLLTHYYQLHSMM